MKAEPKDNEDSAMIERKALIFNIQKYNMYDGPGVRTLVFFKGCPLRCLWCSNPEGQLKRYQVMFKLNLCVHCGACAKVCPVGVHKMTLDGQHFIASEIECVGCRKCEAACAVSALRIAGEEKTISELVEIIEEDLPFYQTSGGGVTLGGGEVLMHPEAATNLLMACRQRGIHTAIETCGYARPEVVAKIAEFTDLFLYDIKQMDSEKHHALTGVRNETILTNLVWLLDNKHNVHIRMPLLKGMNDSEKDILKAIDFLRPYQDYKNFKGIDLLPYHKMGVNKYTQLGWEYPIKDDPALSDADLARIEGYIKKCNFPVSVIRH